MTYSKRPARRILRHALVSIFVFAVTLPSFAAADESSSPRRLTSDGKLKMDPVFIKHGDEIVYSTQDKVNQIDLMRLTLADRKVEPVHPGVSTSELCMTFSRDEKTRAFILNNANLHVLLVIERPADAYRVEYNPGGGFAAVRSVSMAPDGSRIVFAFPEQAEQQIWSLLADGKTKTAITSGGGFDGYPRFSPDGRWIAFASTRDGNFDIFTMTAQGTQIERLTEHVGIDTRPSWSPDGKQLAFTSLRDGNYDIYAINVDGTHLRRVTTNPERDDFPCWHPNGKQLVVVSERDGRQDLYLVDVPE